MARSGTSLLAKLLLDCGLYFGPLHKFVKPHAVDNPDGYWEKVGIVRLNRAILATLGGSDAAPPPLSPGWSHDPRLEDLRRKAGALVSEFDGAPYWGWKDPQTMLTLELWQQVVPDARYAFIFRNPLEVAMSFVRRNDYRLANEEFFDLHRALMLWRHHHDLVLALLPPERTVFVSYRKLMSDSASELPRIVQATGLPATEEQVAAARQSVKPELYRNRFSASLVRELSAAEPVRELYERLTHLAGAADESNPNSEEREAMARILFEEAYRDLSVADRELASWRTRAFQLHAYAKRLEAQLGVGPGEGGGTVPK
ncbi:MAG: sulfotransferase [Fimbriimonas ginsengisoli]|uniref:Sulfotransferase n=1 Tax=Fimbriimonas ginsengisoli TaxID=1005039 RepID=A0A931PU84_FIMGI|nr:sulfotransferase [Fimbriimonas ginsengisoli]